MKTVLLLFFCIPYIDRYFQKAYNVTSIKGNRSVRLQLQYFSTGGMKLMKSCVFHKKYLLAGIYIIFVLFTCCNSRFYHTPLAKICSVTEKQTLSREGTRGSKEYYYTQKITARILNGSHKGEKITVSNEYTSSQVQTKKYHKGDTVLLSGSKESPGKTIRSVKRDGYLALLAGGLFFLLICITGKQGFYTIISLILNTVIFAYGFQAFTEG